MGSLAGAVLSLGSLLVASGCGPSLRGVAQGRVYFERCYAADFDARIPIAEKHACWTAWNEHYTRGQPHERLQYATDRLHALERGESLEGLPGLPDSPIGRTSAPITVSQSAPVEPDVSEEAAPPPANVDAEDPETPATRRHPPRLPRASNDTCAVQACEARWRVCAEACPAFEDACETACEVEMYACARGCF